LEVITCKALHDMQISEFEVSRKRGLQLQFVQGLLCLNKIKTIAGETS